MISPGTGWPLHAALSYFIYFWSFQRDKKEWENLSPKMGVEGGQSPSTKDEITLGLLNSILIALKFWNIWWYPFGQLAPAWWICLILRFNVAICHHGSHKCEVFHNCGVWSRHKLLFFPVNAQFENETVFPIESFWLFYFYIKYM